jgi:hypothetical protein
MHVHAAPSIPCRLVAVLIAVALASSAFGQPSSTTVVGSGPGTATASRVVTASATVTAIDITTREVTLRRANGGTFTVVAGPDVRNLPQLRVGDTVTVDFYDALAIELKKGGTGAPASRSETATRSRAEPGERPGGIATRETVIVADVIAVNATNQTVSLRGPGGRVVDLAIRDPEQFKRIAVGDQVEASYAEAAAVSITPAPAPAAQSPAPWPTGTWRFAGTLYLYGPSIDGTFAFPKRSGEGNVVVDASDLFDSLNGAFMGAFEANNGRWGVFTDFLYVDISGSKSATRDFSISDVNVPASVTADLDLRLKGSAWTIAGEWRLQSTRESTVDVLLGARYLDVKPKLSFGLNGDVASIPAASRGGSFEVKASNWDAIVGVKARYAFGDRLQWYVPLYADVGAGDSHLTWQAAAGLGYAFGWGDVVGLWRYLRYDFKSDQAIQNLAFSGPMIGVTFRW